MTTELTIYSPLDGTVAATLEAHDALQVTALCLRAQAAQGVWTLVSRAERERLLLAYADALTQAADKLATCITREGGKTPAEARAEALAAAEIIRTTIAETALPERGGMLRRKERPPLGVVALITSYNFPIAVAHWTLAPALLAGNTVVWKPSEKTPGVALECKKIFDATFGAYADVFHVAVGAGDVGAALVSHPSIAMVSATGSVAMGKAIRTAANAKLILELGGNNAAIVSEHCTPEHIRFAAGAILSSFLATGGQRCTNTRRVFVHKAHYNVFVAELSARVERFIESGAIAHPDTATPSEYNYAPLIDARAFAAFEHAKAQTIAAGGTVLQGARLQLDAYPDAYYVAPALALLSEPIETMNEEVFAPLLYIVPYEGALEVAIAYANAPANAGLVGAIYTLKQSEADAFARANEAGHTTINSPKGTGTPAYGMGFGGNKDSGCGEILNSADPLAAFTREGEIHRIAQNAAITMQA